MISVGGYPLFHVAAEELDDIQDLVQLVKTGTPEAQFHAWKRTDKVDELTLVLQWAADPYK